MARFFARSIEVAAIGGRLVVVADLGQVAGGLDSLIGSSMLGRLVFTQDSATALADQTRCTQSQVVRSDRMGPIQQSCSPGRPHLISFLGWVAST